MRISVIFFVFTCFFCSPLFAQGGDTVFVQIVRGKILPQPTKHFFIWFESGSKSIESLRQNPTPLRGLRPKKVPTFTDRFSAFIGRVPNDQTLVEIDGECVVNMWELVEERLIHTDPQVRFVEGVRRNGRGVFFVWVKDIKKLRQLQSDGTELFFIKIKSFQSFGSAIRKRGGRKVLLKISEKKGYKGLEAVWEWKKGELKETKIWQTTRGT